MKVPRYETSCPARYGRKFLDKTIAPKRGYSRSIGWLPEFDPFYR
jgi:hypothetical protein